MTDIVERLRAHPDHVLGVIKEAADEIKRLLKINNELIAVLEKIADLHRGPGSALARSALDTMKVLEK